MIKKYVKALSWAREAIRKSGAEGQISVSSYKIRTGRLYVTINNLALTVNVEKCVESNVLYYFGLMSSLLHKYHRGWPNSYLFLL